MAARRAQVPWWCSTYDVCAAERNYLHTRHGCWGLDRAGLDATGHLAAASRGVLGLANPASCSTRAHGLAVRGRHRDPESPTSATAAHGGAAHSLRYAMTSAHDV